MKVWLAGDSTMANGNTPCPTGWGSLAETRSAATVEPVTNIRTGRHACFDRMVVDVPGAGSSELGYSVRYVSRLYQDGSGRQIAVGGGAVIEVRVAAPAYDPDTGKPTYPAKAGQRLTGVNLTGYRTFRDARFAGRTKYPLRRLYRLATDGIASSSVRPLMIAQFFTFVLAVLLVALIGVLVFRAVTNRPADPVESWFLWGYLLTSLIGFLLMSCLYIVCGYIRRMYVEVKGRPPYVVMETVRREDGDGVAR